ncbi:type II secretion system minor pseudopilin GspK [Entomohabitans teleogrylli]|uniref:type II secretion system minor pseudopilin GspK n=1 Tax=Entomohabitans teleogrylli TaxID=1384589 RepID=UPI00073D4D5F|nr:type II secretion system minor pseudopilin GspK [Entomohabitans teleogrylli]
MSRQSAARQQGVALLVVLILLVMMSALAAKISQQFCRSLQKTHYQVSQQQLRWAIQRQEDVVKERLQSDTAGQSKALSPQGEWHEPEETQGEDYTVISQVEDAQNCFNVNSLLAADPAAQNAGAATLAAKPAKQQIVEQLLARAGMSSATAEEVYWQLLDYLDADSITQHSGSENDAWAGSTPPRLPANQMMRTLSEIKLLPAFPAADYGNVSHWLCALPDTDSRVDVNTLRPEQAELLAALFTGQLTTDDAARLIESRPAQGWESVEAFAGELEKHYPQVKESLAQIQTIIAVNSRYFQINSTGTSDDLTLRVVSQLHVDGESGDMTIWQRRYRMIE